MADADYIHGRSKKEQKRLNMLNQLTNEDFIDFLDIQSGYYVLDIGCGMGHVLIELARRNSNCMFYGVDISSEQLSKIPPLAGDNLIVQKVSANQLNFKDNTFDVVYLRYLLEHVKNPLAVVNEAYRVLKPDGKIFVQENNILFMDFYPNCPKFLKIWHKFVYLQKLLGGDALIGKKLFSIFSKTNFRNIELSFGQEIHYAGKKSFPFWIENLIGNIRGAENKFIENSVASKDEIDAACLELEKFRNKKYSSTYFCWNRLKAEK